MVNDTYNNIGISLIAFLAMCRHNDELDYSKTLLFAPLLLHNQLVKYLKNKTTKPKGLEDLIATKTEYFLDFNKRYFSFLELSINTLIIAQQMEFITFRNNKIVINKKQIESFDFTSQNLGQRATNIIEAANQLSKLLTEETKSLYFKIRVEI